jgi:tetratricopeptide (TPR) repeat protein
MIKKFVGKSRAENLDWLLNKWLKAGPPVCFLQGFPGVGKSDLARDFRELAERQGPWQHAVIDEIADRPTPSILESLMELSVVLSRQGLKEMEKVLFEETDPNLGYAVEKALQQPVVIILDEAQRFFREDSGSPLPEMNGILSFLRNRPKLPGRLLLLSDRVVEEARWSEWIPKRTLKELAPEEAIELLETRLKENEVSADISEGRKNDIVRALYFNPRAIEVLVGALRFNSLDEIIESNPGLWAVRDRNIDRSFLRALESDLLERTMRHLEVEHQRRLWRLAVHRRSFKREALERLCGTMDEAALLRSVLVTRFLLNFYKGTLTLHAIVREISLSHLRDEPAEFRQAHSAAADYHLRHFKARQIVGTHSFLAESFAELRYHLVQAGRLEELRVIGHRFTDHLKRNINSSTPVPTDREELDERIGVLTALLENEGAKGLEYHLARCLQKRSKPGDAEQAAIHAERMLGPEAPDASWYLFANLKWKVEGTDAAVAAIRRGLSEMLDKDVAAPLYQLGAEILAKADRTREAVGLLREGLDVIPPDKSLSTLYQACADLLATAGKTEEAVALLIRGIQVIPPEKNLFSLYIACADLLAKSGKRDDAVALLIRGIKVIQPEQNLFTLYQALSEVLCRIGNLTGAIEANLEGGKRIPAAFSSHKLLAAAMLLSAGSGNAVKLSEIVSTKTLDNRQVALGTLLQQQLQGDWSSAANTARASRIEFPGYIVLAAAEAFSRLASGDAYGAWNCLTSFQGLIFDTAEPQTWLAAFIHLRRDAQSDAADALAKYLGRPVNENEVTENCLLRLWDQQEVFPEGKRLCFHFPIMPASLTGLDHPVWRVPFAKPVLPSINLRDTNHISVPAPTAQTQKPEIYVSYAWGEDSTADGIKREEIVNRLCEAVHASGREIGRDKERLLGGDSIERFAKEISKAKRVIAVISAKFLHSDFCMAQELFCAYRRCDYNRAEFQEKVIALVMDDARPFLKDDPTTIALAKEWKEKHEKLIQDLQTIDPSRKSHDSWVFLDLVGEMVPRLPAMLAALRDIVMKRGFDEIVRDKFQEVISRLP